MNPTRRFAFVNYLFLAANVVIAVKTFFLIPPERYEEIVFAWGYVPAEGRWLTLVTAQFLHGGVAHLIGNMLFLWIVGDNVEDKLGHLGYVVFYLLSGIAAGLVHGAAYPDSAVPCIGASGAISGVMAAYAILFPWSRIKIVYVIPIFIFAHIGTTTVRAFWAIGFWFLEQLLFTALSLSERLGGMSGVAYGAHVGGFLFGGLSILALVLVGRVRRNTSVR